MSKVRNAVTIGDLRRLAKRRLPDFAFMPMEEGCGNGRGPMRNRDAFDRYRIVPRALVDTRIVDQSVELFGQRYASPFGISAIGLADRMRRGTDEALAETAAAARIPFILSGGSTTPIERIARLAPGYVWQQLYAAADRAISDDFLARGADSGCSVLVFTVDMLAPLSVDWLRRAGIHLPASIEPRAWPRIAAQLLLHPGWALSHAARGGLPACEGWRPYAPAGASGTEVTRFAGSQMLSGADWTYLEHVRKQWPGTLVIKGLLHADDAGRAFDLGADAITISNHGGNRLDNAVAPLDVLPAIHAARTDRQILLYDGGIRRGSDILIARALGADFSFSGRAILYGALAGGTEGAMRAVEILQEEIGRTLAHSGCTRVEAFTRDHVATVAG